MNLWLGAFLVCVVLAVVDLFGLASADSASRNALKLPTLLVCGAVVLFCLFGFLASAEDPPTMLRNRAIYAVIALVFILLGAARARR